MKQTFEAFFKLFCECDGNIAGTGGVFGSYDVTDYAPGDTRIPKSLFAVKRYKKSKKHGKKNTKHRIARR